MSNTKIVVTGATGFIGQHVMAALCKHEVEVIAVTRDLTGLGNIGSAVRGVQMDIAEHPEDAFELLGRPDVLIHLAWGGLPNYRSLHHFETELPRQFHFMKAMVEAGLASMIVAGTCLEYGLQSGPLSEEFPTQPCNPYGYAKDALRQQLEYLKLAMPFSLTWARIFYLYGDGQPRNSLYPQLKYAVLRGERVFNMSGGEQLRDYLSVEDLAQLIAFLAERRIDAGCLNVCSGKPISVRTLVEKWIAENEWPIELNLGHYSYPDHEPLAFWGDRRKLDRLLE